MVCLKKNTPTALEFVLLFVLIFANSFVVTRFFTNDKYDKVTDVSKKTNEDKLINFPEEKLNTDIENFDINNTKFTIKEEIAKVENDLVKKDLSVPSVTSRTSTSRESIKTKEHEEVHQVEIEESEPVPIIAEPVYSAPIVPDGQVSIGTIQISKTGVDMHIFKKVSVAGMETGACVMYSSGSINESGTTVLVSHNYCNGKLFSNNKYLNVGDTITITANGVTKVYTIYDTFITSSDDISYIERNTTNEAEIALSTCTDNEEKRLVILAK